MKTTVTFCDFCDAFRDMGRNENFSYEGKRALFDYLEQYEDGTGHSIELDVVALCCDFTEASWDEIADYYRIDLTECGDNDEKAEAVREYLQDNTTCIEVSDGLFIYGAF